MLARKTLSRTLPPALLLGSNAAIILLALYFRQTVVPGWKKGPLIDPAAPYAPENATLLFALSACLALDVYLLLAYLWHRRLKKRWWAPWLLLLSSLLVSELFVRAYLAVDMVTYFRPHPTLHWVVRPNLHNFKNLKGGGTISTNRDGMREVTVPTTKGPDEFRILVLGDSSNFGHGVEGNETWSSVLQDLLNERHPGQQIQVLNGSCPGWTTFQAVEFMRETGLRYHPDVVIAGFNNDPGPDYLGDRQRLLPEGPVRSLNGTLFHLETYLLAREVVLSLLRRYSQAESQVYSARNAGQEPTYGNLPEQEQSHLVPRVPLDEFIQNLRTLATPGQGTLGTQAEPYTFVWMNMPVNRTQPELVERYVNQQYRDNAHLLAKELGFLVIDVDSAWRTQDADDLFLPGHVFHPSAKGHRRIAEQVERSLLDSNLVPGLSMIGSAQPERPLPRMAAGPSRTNDAPSEPDHLVLGFSSLTPVHAHIGLVLEDHPEIARDLDFDLELRDYRSGRAQGEDVSRGVLDAFFTCEVPAVQMLRSRPDTRIIASPGSLGRIAVVAKSSRTTSLEALNGSKVGLVMGSTPAMDWKTWGGDIQAQVVALRTEELFEALETNRVDAIAGWDPWVEDWLARSNGGMKILSQRSFRSELAVSMPWAQVENDRASRLVQMVARALSTAAAHRPLYDEAVADLSGWPLEVVKAVADRNSNLSGQSTDMSLTDLDRDSMERAIAFLGITGATAEQFFAPELLAEPPPRESQPTTPGKP